MPSSAAAKPNTLPFAGKPGFGGPTYLPNQVLSLIGPPPPLIYCFLDSVVHKPKYSSASGRVLAYLLNTQLFQFATSPDIKEKMVGWFMDILRSPLSDAMKEWFLRTSHQLSGAAPPLLLEDGTPLSPSPMFSFLGHLGQISSSQIIAACVGRACPHPGLQRIFQGACPIPLLIEPYCQRRNNMYGVFFCSTSTLSEMQDSGLWVESIDLGAAFATGVATWDELYMKVYSYLVYYLDCLLFFIYIIFDMVIFNK
jgi:hypothetical protein